ncbi:helix-turn-helix domain-containing protein [Aquimarina litoralis]|uniref:helix-turn-helix domain-containing protein n=1 Tax=Aquimarina litoralis TaxID=584605 RepID=UPI001C56999E|nr:AraC family transcriptional regulator [Aquimarina litoralis]MBW1294454.1 helix-turn-helix domain-containing protein [Aquimarina litoralis]
MKDYTMKYIQSGDLIIAVSCEATSNKITEVYSPSTLLLYTQIGTLHVQIGDKKFDIRKGQFALLRKYTEAKLYKTLDEEMGFAKTYGFGLTNDFIERVIHEIALPKIKSTTEAFFDVPNTQKLNSLMLSLIEYIDNGEEIDIDTIESKTLEALRAIAEANTDLLKIFKEFSNNERVSIEKIMKHNFLYNIPLETIAKQSGRSLSTFHREFKTIFNETPHRWIMKQRLYHARNLMKVERMKPSNVYLESGFEDLAHFSKSFKKQFNITPSEFYNSL